MMGPRYGYWAWTPVPKPARPSTSVSKTTSRSLWFMSNLPSPLTKRTDAIAASSKRINRDNAGSVLLQRKRLPKSSRLRKSDVTTVLYPCMGGHGTLHRLDPSHPAPKGRAMSASSADRNLLFGVLALQADFLDCRQFAEACSAWAGRKQTPLADLLIERGWLTAEDKGLVERLLDQKLQKHAGMSRPASPPSWTTRSGRYSARSTTRPSGSPWPRLPAANYSLLGTVAPASDVPGRYSLTRLHGKGGIGQVWLARDHDLGREVALKELRPDRGGNPAVTARFLEEAKITGQLEHPGIVPIYELARRATDQQPYYAMRFVQGRTLAEAINAYHGKRQADEVGPLDLRALLGAFVAVCNAVAYAHSRGVLHRDLKGQNVVLGDFGEVMVLDWGLAKLLGAKTEPAGPLPVSLEKEATRDQTRQGQVLGTPAYMPPEQAEGRHDRVDRWSDVYSLGAILYEILTGEPPFDGADTLEVLKKVAHEPPVPPRQKVLSTPLALQAVCLKALAKKAGRPLCLGTGVGRGGAALVGGRAGPRLSRALAGARAAGHAGTGRWWPAPPHCS